MLRAKFDVLPYFLKRDILVHLQIYQHTCLVGFILAWLLMDFLLLNCQDCKYLLLHFIFVSLNKLFPSPSLGMKDSWGPLKALAVSSAINGIGDVALCMLLGYGIAGAAWATMVSQVLNESKIPIYTGVHWPENTLWPATYRHMF